LSVEHFNLNFQKIKAIVSNEVGNIQDVIAAEGKVVKFDFAGAVKATAKRELVAA